MGMFSRAHSGNLNVFRRATERWDQQTDYSAQLGCWYEPRDMTYKVVAKIIHKRTREVLIEKDFTDTPHIRDEDVQTITVATWFNKQFNDYTGE